MNAVTINKKEGMNVQKSKKSIWEGMEGGKAETCNYKLKKNDLFL